MYLLDTNVVSELRKIRLGKADGHVADRADSTDATDLYLSVITIQELEIGVVLAELTCPLSPYQSFGRKSGCHVKGFLRCKGLGAGALWRLKRRDTLPTA